MPKIELSNFGVIPGRTKVLIISIPIPTGDMVIDASNVQKEYECMDCGYKTHDVDEMLEHQSNQTKHHSIWQRIKRWWYLLPFYF